VAAPRFSSSARERIAVIDLGPPGDKPAAARRRDRRGGLRSGDRRRGVDDALAGRDLERDAVAMAAAMTTAAQAFGQLACGDAIPGGAPGDRPRGAAPGAGLAVPELPRRVGLRAAMRRSRRASSTRRRPPPPAPRARRLARCPGRGCGPSIPRSMRSPTASTSRSTSTADIAGAEIWVDFQRAGTSPVHLALPAGEHVLAAALARSAAGRRHRRASAEAGARPDDRYGRPWADLAQRRRGWHGAPPPPTPCPPPAPLTPRAPHRRRPIIRRARLGAPPYVRTVCRCHPRSLHADLGGQARSSGDHWCWFGAHISR